MKRPDVYITRIIPQPAVDHIKKHYTVEKNPEDRVLSKNELIDQVKDRRAVLCLLTDVIDRKILDAAGPHRHRLPEGLLPL